METSKIDINQQLPKDFLRLLSKNDLIDLFCDVDRIRVAALKKSEALRKELEDEKILLEGRFVRLKTKIFDKGSEKSPRPKGNSGSNNKNKRRSKSLKRPSDRYPNIPILERYIDFDVPPGCGPCGAVMADSKMVEMTEFLHVIPRQYLVIRQFRRKYRCVRCHGSVLTAPAPPRIQPGSTFSDEMMIDVSLSKYCDLIPIERQAAMAARQGVAGLSPNSLIELTHTLAKFLQVAAEGVRMECLAQRVLQADETTHRMLEGDEKKRWFLWGFSCDKGVYFTIENTRSGQVASKLLVESQCEVLVSDVFSGYCKAVTDANKIRKDQKNPKMIRHSWCHAHARRKFVECKSKFPKESEFFIGLYKQVYHLEKLKSEANSADKSKYAKIQKHILADIKCFSIDHLKTVSSKSDLAKAANYFIGNYEGLTLFLDDHDVPIDNNRQERTFRSPVVGRKIWLGTHSIRGANTASVHMTLVESCKLIGVNPREYYPAAVFAVLRGQPPPTPYEFKIQKLKDEPGSKKS